MSTQRNNRYGRFEISHELLDAEIFNLLPLFASVVVVRAESRYDKRVIEYYGYSEMFRELPEGNEAPLYSARMTRGDDGNVKLMGWEELA